MRTGWAGLIFLGLIFLAVVFALIVNREKHVQDITRSQSACAVTIFYKGGYGFGYDYRARVSSKGETLALVYLGIYDQVEDINMDFFEFVDNSVRFKLYYGGEELVVYCGAQSEAD